MDAIPDGTWTPWQTPEEKDGEGWEDVSTPETPWLHCSIGYTGGDPTVDPWTYIRNGQATIQLKTGGRSVAHNDLNLFSFSGRANEIPRSQWEAPEPGSIPINPERIVLGAVGRLGYDGKLYRMLADNQEVNITPTVSDVPYYTFYVTAQKHRVAVTANGQLLDRHFVSTESKFPTGQKIIFATHITPALPVASPLAGQTQWHLSEGYVNAIETIVGGFRDDPRVQVRYCHPAQTIDIGRSAESITRSPKYFKHEPLLANEETGAWYFKGGMKLAIYHTALKFSNGQLLTINTPGIFEIERPESGPSPQTSSSLYYAFKNTWYRNPRASLVNDGSLTLGSALDPNRQPMGFVFWTRSSFQGKANYIQLINAFFSASPLFNSTDDQMLKDGSGRYNVHDTIISRNTSEDVSFIDGPSTYGYVPIINLLTTDYLLADAQFITYLQYRPDGPDNIWITLKRVEWNWSAQAILSQGTWSISVHDCPDPKYYEDDSFPYYPSTYTTLDSNARN